MSRPGYNSKVAAILGGMGVDTKHQEKKEREERPKYSAATARVLESIGVKVPQQEVAGLLNEAAPSPLQDTGAQPMAQSGQPQQQQVQQPQQPQQQQPPNAKPMGSPNVSLKKQAGGIKTLTDVSDKLTEVTKRIRTIDLLLQTMQSDDTTDNSIEANKDTIRGPLRNLLNSVKDLEKLVE